MSRVVPVMLVALLMVSPLAIADDEDGDDRRNDSPRDKDERHDNEQDDDDGRDERRHDADRVKRKARFEVSGEQAKIKLERNNGSSEDEIKVHYVASAGTLKVEYSTENATTGTETELKVRVKEVVEFRDANGDGGYQKNDTVVARYPIGELDWRIVGPEPINTSGQVGQRITGIGDFPQGGALVLVMYVYGDFATLNGTSLAPTDVKIDIIFDHFPYQANDTQVALVVKSEQETEIEVEGDEAGEMSATANGFAAYFEWADNATVDGVSKPVVTKVFRSELDDNGSEKTFSLAYARGTFINHDPVLGIQSASEDVQRVPGIGAIGILAVALVAVAIVSRRRSG